MAVHSRSRAAAARSGGGDKHQHHHASTTRAAADQPPRLPTTSSACDDDYDDDDEENIDVRPSKRRKLSIRNKHHQQTTLDHHFTPATQSGQPKPPTKIAVAQPHGRLVETINGVRNVLDADEDDLSLPRSTVVTPSPGKAPKPAPKKQEDKRTLRSQDEGPRLKSELAIYFPNYEDVIFDVPRETEFITLDSALYITDDPPPKQGQGDQASPGKSGVKAAPSTSRKHALNGTTPRSNSSNYLNGSPSLNLDLISRTLPDRPEDPLLDDHFLKSHRRAERKEKQLRNIEKERAMHEKVQLDRLLDGLLGHDWLKVLGITGVTETEARKFEPKRQYFIAEVRALVEKFKQWKEQEKRQRSDRDAATSSIPAAAVKQEIVDEGDEYEAEESDQGSSIGPPSSDLNASASRQLQQETFSALKSSTTNHNKTITTTPHKPSLKHKRHPSSTLTSPKHPVTFAPAPPELPITSFYPKRHLRDAALGKNARSSRNALAFGHPVPDGEEREFALPGEVLNEEAVRANAREKRRRKREREGAAAAASGNA